jgi:phospholipid/cholesterol/gamma-HCH transport system substrate-binding protein
MGRHGIAETLTGALVLAVALVFMAYAVAHSGRTTSEGYTLQARFDRIDGLTIGGDVRIAGVKIGSVTGERLDPQSFDAIVSMSINQGLQLPIDTGAVVSSESLLGGKYISLSPGGDQKILKPGQMITITQSSVNLETLLGKFIFSVTSLNGGKDKLPADQAGGASTTGGSSGGGGGGTGLPPLSK